MAFTIKISNYSGYSFNVWNVDGVQDGIDKTGLYSGSGSLTATLSFTLSGYGMIHQSPAFSFQDGLAYTYDAGAMSMSSAPLGGGNTAPVATFYADTYIFNNGVGGNVTLFWSITGTPTPSASINQGIGGITVSGSRVVNVTTTTTFTLVANNSAGSDTKTVTIQVNAAPPPPTGAPIINSFTCTPNPVPQGSTGLLYWSVDPNGLATSVTISTIGAVGNSGTQGLPNFQNTIQLVLTAVNSAGTRTMTLTVTKADPLPVSIDSFTANGSSSALTIMPGAYVDVAWQTTNATQVTLENGNNGPMVENLDGTARLGPINETAEFFLIATGPGGTQMWSIDIIVSTSGNSPIISKFKATPAIVEAGESSTVEWASNGDYATLDDGTTGAVSVAPTATILYGPVNQAKTLVLRVTNAYGTVTRSITITIGTTPPASSTPTTALIIGGVALGALLLAGRNKK